MKLATGVKISRCHRRYIILCVAASEYIKIKVNFEISLHENIEREKKRKNYFDKKHRIRMQNFKLEQWYEFFVFHSVQVRVLFESI